MSEKVVRIKEPGTIVWVISNGPLKKIKCRICNSTGNVLIKNKEFMCPECVGFGYKEKYCNPIVQSGEIVYCEVYLDSDEFAITYQVSTEYDYLSLNSSQVYKTERTAMNALKRQNRKRKKK